MKEEQRIVLKWMTSISFYRRIQILLVIFILLPILIISIISYSIITDEVTERVRQSNHQVMNTIDVNLNKVVDDITVAANYFANDVTFHNAMRQMRTMKQISSYLDYEAYQRISDYYDLVDIKMFLLGTKMFVANPEDFIIPSSSSFSMAEIQQKWKNVKGYIDFQNAQTMQWIGIMPRNESFEEYIIARVLKHKTTGEYLGTLVIGIPKAFFHETFEIVNMGRVTLYDHHDHPIFKYESNEFTSTHIVERKVYSSSKNWKFIHEISSDEMTGKIANTFYVFFIAAVGCVVLFLIISVFMAKRLNRPLHNIIRIANKFGSGNLNVRFATHGKDEFTVLGRAFNSMLDQIQSLIANIETEQEEKRIIELQALFAQIRPHFLINTLNSMKLNMLIDGNTSYSKSMESLIALLRAYMRVHEPWKLTEECKMIERYLEIMQLRTGHAVQLVIDVEESMKDFSVPRLLLQPIVENAVVHGFSERNVSAVIEIKAKQLEHETIISIKDNGKGMTDKECMLMNQFLSSTEDENLEHYDRVGLVNVSQRVKLTYGKESFIHVEQNQDGGVTFIFHFWMNKQYFS